MTAQIFAFEHSGKSYELSAGDNAIGSGDQCAVKIEAEGIDPVHALVALEGDRVVLRSRPESEDVRVNGKPTRVEDLKAGDKVRIGVVELSVEQTDGGGLKLTAADGPHRLKSGENTIGRADEAAITLEDDSVSREHASILVLPSGRVRIRDLLSSNGTFVNDQRLGEVELDNGDKIEVGNERLVLLALKAPAAAASDQAATEDATRIDDASTEPLAPPDKTRIASEVDLPPTPGGAPEAAAPATPAAAPAFELIMDGTAHPLSPGVHRIGRAPDCEFQITDDSEVSRYHAQLTVEEDKVKLKDLDSSNGTMLNGGKSHGEFALSNGDKIQVGAKEMIFKTDEPVDFMGKTVLAQDVLASLGETVLSADLPSPDVIKALDLLELDTQASPEQIQKRFQELYSDFQIRSTNAPTPELKEKYQTKLAELKQAAEQLIPQYATAEDLPASEPVLEPVGAAPTPESAPAEPIAPEPAVEPPPEPPKKAKKKAKPAKKPKKAKAEGGVPSSTWLMAALGALAAVACVVLWFKAGAAGSIEADLQAQRDGLAQSMADMEVSLPETQLAIQSLEEGRATLLENAEFKICNLSSDRMLVLWLHTTYTNPDGSLQSFDSAYHGYPEWEIAAGGTGKFNHIVDDEVIWDGTAIFFSVLIYYRGQESLRSGSIQELGGECYNLKLD